MNWISRGSNCTYADMYMHNDEYACYYKEYDSISHFMSSFHSSFLINSLQIYWFYDKTKRKRDKNLCFSRFSWVKLYEVKELLLHLQLKYLVLEPTVYRNVINPLLRQYLRYNEAVCSYPEQGRGHWWYSTVSQKGSGSYDVCCFPKCLTPLSGKKSVSTNLAIGTYQLTNWYVPT